MWNSFFFLSEKDKSLFRRNRFLFFSHLSLLRMSVSTDIHTHKHTHARTHTHIYIHTDIHRSEDVQVFSLVFLLLSQVGKERTLYQPKRFRPFCWSSSVVVLDCLLLWVLCFLIGLRNKKIVKRIERLHLKIKNNKTMRNSQPKLFR